MAEHFTRKNFTKKMVIPEHPFTYTFKESSNLDCEIPSGAHIEFGDTAITFCEKANILLQAPIGSQFQVHALSHLIKLSFSEIVESVEAETSKDAIPVRLSKATWEVSSTCENFQQRLGAEMLRRYGIRSGEIDNWKDRLIHAVCYLEIKILRAILFLIPNKGK